MWTKIILLMLGGAAGTLARYGLGHWIGTQNWARGFPFGTLIINVSGSFVLAAVFVCLDRLGGHENWFLLLGTGFCGGYTTFSAFEMETYDLIIHQRIGKAFVYVVGSVVLGFGAVVAAVSLIHALWPKK